MEEHDKNSIDFVAKYWRKGAFIPVKLPIVGIVGTYSRRWAVAAVTAGVIALSAIAAIYFSAEKPERESRKTVEITLPAVDENGCARIEFTDIPLLEAVSQIEKIYNVEIDGKSNISSDTRVSLSWEGSVDELITTINTMFNTKLTVIK